MKARALKVGITTVTIEGEKIKSVRVAKVDGGGVMGILSQLGVEAPPQ